MGIVHEEGTDNNLDNNLNSTAASIETVQEQNEISDDEEFFDQALDELINFTRQEMKGQDKMIEMLEKILAKD